jgi:diguanylate cyclase (GGDEF)-like protein
MSKIDNYYNHLSICIDNVKAVTADVSSFRNIDLEEMRVDAISSLRDLFDRSDKATYDFFFAVAKRFLFVLLFLFITMFAGLITISRSKKRDRAFALQVQASRMKIESAKQKVRDVAYSDILTGFKNRHALFEMLDEKMKTDNVSLAVYHFNDFRKIYTDHGRDCGDEYISSMSQKFEEEFGTQAEMYSIGESEFCAVFDSEILRGQIGVIAQKMMALLSESIPVSNMQIACNVSGCLCHCHPKQYASSADLFKVVDTNISQLKQKCAESGMSQLIQI